jgi:DNA (cytosine-5)-methyltransferase 1
MQVISLFSGIGGFDLAAQWLGWHTVAFCEIDRHCRRVLSKHWPDTYIHHDIHTLDYDTLIQHSSWQPTEPTILVGGFPCQPFSVAGQQRGKADDRYLWPQMERLVAELRPRHVLAENVPGLIQLGLDEVLSGLEAKGYATRANGVPACAVGAGHIRQRVWIYAADTKEWGRGQRGDCDFQKGQDGSETPQSDSSVDATADTTIQQIGWQEQQGLPPHTGGGITWVPSHPDRTRWGQLDATTQPIRAEQHTGLDAQASGHTDWWQAESQFRGIPDGLSTGLDKGRRQHLKQLGNAIVPQVAYELLRYVQAVDALHYPNSQS